VALAAAFFLPVLAHPDRIMTPGREDLVQFAARTHYQVANTLKNGELTLWDPYADCGAPVVGNIQNATFYPLNILFYIMPTDYAFSLLFFGNTLLAGIFAYLLVRSFGLSRGAGLAGSIMYMFSGVWTPKLFPGHFMVYNNFPWIILGLYLVRKAVLSAREGKWSAGVFFTLLLAVSQAAQFFGGHTQFWLYSTVFLVAFGLFEVCTGAAKSGLKRAAVGGAFVFAALAVCVLLVMIQLLPAAEFAGQVLDDGKRPSAYRSWGGFNYGLSIMAIAPRYFGSVEQQNYWRGNPQWEVSPYIGILPLLLAAVALFIVRNRYVWYFCAAGIFALLFSAGDRSAVYLAVSDLPGFSAFRVPGRMLTVALPCAVVLVGFAWERLFSRKSPMSNWTWVVPVCIAILMGAYMMNAFAEINGNDQSLKSQGLEEIKQRGRPDTLSTDPMSEDEAIGKVNRAIAETKRELFIGGAICAVAAGLFALAGRGGRVRTACGFAALALITADLMAFGMPFLRTTRAAEVFPDHTPLLDCLNDRAKNEPLFRIADYHSPTGSCFIYHQLRRHDFNIVYGDLDSSKLKCMDAYRNCARANHQSNDFYNALNVRYYVSKKPIQDYQAQGEQLVGAGEVAQSESEAGTPVYPKGLLVGDVYLTGNPESFERAFVVRRVRPMVGETPDHIMAVLAGKGAMRNLAVIEEEPDFTLDGKGEFQNATVTDYRPNRVTVEVSLDEPGFLVLSEIWYPDWHAYDVADVGRTELRVYKTNVAMRGVFLKAGKHRVDFIYEPRSYYAGKAVTFVSVPIVLALLVVSGVMARKMR
jgi:hypothetical protein